MAKKKVSPPIPPIEFSIALAANLHANQHDKIGEPYILHPIRVMLAMCTLVERTVAILHDVLEDTKATPRYLLRQGYPKRIVQAIQSVSKNEGETYQQFLERAAIDPIGLKVKIADMRDNMSPIRQYSLPPDKKNYLHKKYQKGIKFLSEKEAEQL